MDMSFSPEENAFREEVRAWIRSAMPPHIRAKVECSTCHGNQAEQTVARRAVNMDMAFSVNCHKSKQASNDCLTCHF